MKKLIVLVMVIVVLMFAGCSKGGDSKVIATVNGVAITQTDLDFELENLPPQYKMFANDPNVRKSIVESLVLNEVIIQYAKANRELDKKEVKDKIEEYKITMKAEIEQQMELLKKQKKRIDKIAAQEIVVNQTIENLDVSGMTVDEKEVQEAYVNYEKRMKMQNPNAEVPALKEIRGNLESSLKKQKWIADLKQKAEVVINEDMLAPAVPAMGSGLKMQVPEGNAGK